MHSLICNVLKSNQRIRNDPDISICSVTAYSAGVCLLRLRVVEGQQREAALHKYLIAGMWREHQI